MKQFFMLVLLVLCINCGKPAPQSPVNLDHALSLVDSIEVNGEQLSFIHIYADAPDYKPLEAPDEGISCVDDVGRFMEVLEAEICRYQITELLTLALGMTRFLLYMSQDNGLWYNFIDVEGNINRRYRTSIAEFQWWAVRGLRGLAAALTILEQYPAESNLKTAVIRRIHSMDSHLDSVLVVYPQRMQTELGPRPKWLVKDAPDLNSELLLVLTKLHGQSDFDYKDEIGMIADGLLEFQYRNVESPLNGMYFCWRNSWHNWGNNQATALLKAYQVTKEKKYLASVQLWADNFVPFLIENNFPWEIAVASDGTYNVTAFPQIAYGIHALYSGLQLLAEITGNEFYATSAETVFNWFRGQNPAGTAVYDPQSGRCFDGINGPGEVNFNSGAESTIECLLAIQKRGKF
ncbi:MAG: hypothetical protein ACP5FZ_10145 [Fidelibacterota bacterium]